MTEKQDDGGPAFPVPDGEAANHGVLGMTLLDYFAGEALKGICANPNSSRLHETSEDLINGHTDAAYLLAAAMIEKRKKWLK